MAVSFELHTSYWKGKTFALCLSAATERVELVQLSQLPAKGAGLKTQTKQGAFMLRVRVENQPGGGGEDLS